MALIQTSLIWVTYGVAIAILFVIASIFVFVYEKPRERAPSVTIVCIFTVLALLATLLLLPVDVALLSATVDPKLGVRKDWATQDEVDSIVFSLKVAYYTLYSLDALLCLLVIPFIYFWYEEYEDDDNEQGIRKFTERLWGAFKYTTIFILVVIILFLVGFFIPVAKALKKKHKNLDYFKHLLAQNHGERALTFALGLLITIGTLIYIIYTAAGLALLPVTLIKSAPSISATTLAADTTSQLEQNRERQRQLEGRNEGRVDGLDAKDRRELEALLREERTLVRRERLAAEASGEGTSSIMRVWLKLGAVFRPIKLIGGLLLMLIALVIWVSMLISGIDKAKNSICKERCGYILPSIKIFQPMNAIFVQSSKVFPVDYIVFLLLVVFLFTSSVVGIATIGIRFLWLSIFRIRKGQTPPQAMLLATILLTLVVLAINYAIVMLIAPQYAAFGPQKFCDRPPKHPGEQPNCSGHRNSIKRCRGFPENSVAKDICTPSVASSFINRITTNFAFFGAIDFWAQFAFLAIYLVTAITTLVRTPKFDTDTLDEDLEEEEQEGLLASTGRRFNATWQDITGRARNNDPPSYGATS